MATCFLHVSLGGFFVAAERARCPELVGRPVIIGGVPDSGGHAVAVSPEAVAAGVGAGDALSQAARSCPDGVFLPGALDVYLEASRLVRREVAAVAPGACWTALGEADLECPGDRGRHAGATALADRVARAITRVLTVDVACGVAAAMVVARAAAALVRPRGLLAVLPGYEARFLAPLPIHLLDGVDSRIAARLRAADITTIGELAAADAAAVVSVVGGCGAVLCDLAHAIDRRRVRPATPSPRALDVRRRPSRARASIPPLLRRLS